MRNLLILATLAAVFALSAAASADLATVTILPGDNWVSAPLVPFDPAPGSVFAACISQCSLKRFDPLAETEVLYGSPSFGSILLGEGYKVHNPTQTTFHCTYEGVADGVPDDHGMTDMWVALPGTQSGTGGMHWVGQPFYHGTSIAASVSVSDGTRLLSLADAVAEGWIDGVWSFMDAENQVVRTAGLSSLGAQDTVLRACHMYEVVTHRDNLALIIEADPAPVPEPSNIMCILAGLVALRRRRPRSRA